MDEQAVKDQLVAAARGYFTRFGYSRVSTGEIAESVGRSKKTLYRHFPSKEDLLRAVLTQINAESEAAILADLSAAGGDYLTTLKSVLSRIGVHHASLGGELLPDLEANHGPLFAHARNDQRKLLQGLIQRFLDSGVEQGVLRRDVDTAATSAAFLASAEALADPRKVAQHAEDPAIIFRTLVGLLVDGLRA